MRPLLPILAAALMAGAPALAQTVTAHRAVVADAAFPVVQVLDLDSGRSLGRYELGGVPARLHRGASGRYVHAVQGGSDRVRLIDTGIAFADHGDHADIAVAPPRLVPHSLDGPRPSHLTHGGGLVAAFFDGAGHGRAIAEDALVRGRFAGARRIETGVPHHGVLMPVGSALAVSVPEAGASLPAAIELRDAAGQASTRLPCPRLHGEAASGRFTGFGCADGIAVYEATRAGIGGRHLPYPARLPPGRMVRNLAGAAGLSLLAGDFGPDGMVLLDPAAEDGAFLFVPLPARRAAFALMDSGERLFVLLEDGRLLGFDATNGAPAGEAAIMAPIAAEAPRPRLSAAGAHLVATDPAAGAVLVLDPRTLALRRRIATGGAPSGVVAVGGTGERH